MKHQSAILYFLFGALLCVLFLIPASKGFAQQDAGQLITVDQLEAQLRQDNRNLSQATPQDLERLAEGGRWSAYVLKIGNSIFILNIAAIFTIGIILVFVVVMFFTPLGLAFFRGGLHAFAGSVLKATGISPGQEGFGYHLMTKPREALKKADGVRNAFRHYMHHDFIPNYKNNVTALAFMGTAFLICMIGLRGVKFMTPQSPDLIIIAIIIEMTVLMFLGLTTWYEKEEDEETGPGGLPNKQLSLDDVERRLEDLKEQFRNEVGRERQMRP
jgi:hypothetical protein